MSIDPKSLSSEQQQRLFDELRKDKEFLKTRNTLLGVTVVGGICLFAAGWMMINKMVTVLDVVTIVALFVFVNAFLARRLSAMQKVVMERWQKEEEARARLAQPFNQEPDAN